MSVEPAMREAARRRAAAIPRLLLAELSQSFKLSKVWSTNGKLSASISKCCLMNESVLLS